MRYAETLLLGLMISIAVTGCAARPMLPQTPTLTKAYKKGKDVCVSEESWAGLQIYVDNLETVIKGY